MSKAHDPHWRYVALELDGPRPVSRRSLQNAIVGRARREGVSDAPQLTRYAWPHAIVKVHHHALAAARAWLGRIDFAVEGEQKVPLRVRTLSSSGTIKALTDRLGILQERVEPKGAATPARPAGPGGHRQASTGSVPPVRAPERRSGRRGT